MKTVIVTRPAAEAMRWVEQLRALQINAQALALININSVREPLLVAELERARVHCSEYRAVMFVSVNAVSHFFAGGLLPEQRTGDVGIGTQIGTRFWSPGPGTSAALAAQGVSTELIDAPASNSGQFDSENLWRVVAPQIRTGDRVLIVRGAQEAAAGHLGGSGRDWLAQSIVQAGGSVDFVAAYQRAAPHFSAAQIELARASATADAMWLFSSSEAIANLCAQLPEVSWDNARALVTHPRIAHRARLAGFGVVSECRPTLHEVAASIKSLL